MKNSQPSFRFARAITLVFALLPVIFFVGIVLMLLWTSVPAVKDVGFNVLFSTKFSNVFSGIYTPGEYGLMPALWGTILVTIVALLFAIPISLSLAIIASDFSFGGIGRLIEAALAIFSGIPPIIYGLLSVFVVNMFIRPKFGGEGLTEEAIRALPGLPEYNAGMLPRELSTLLGAIFLCLLIIPFISPLMLDALRNVPASLKEASLGLGATKWYTLRRISLPAALTGLIAAISLGSLKTIGDVVIVAWTIGYVKRGLPVPVVDIFERSAPLTSTGAGLLTGLSPGADVKGGLDYSVAFFAGLLLMVMAFGILGLSNQVQKILQKRFEQ